MKLAFGIMVFGILLVISAESLASSSSEASSHSQPTQVEHSGEQVHGRQTDSAGHGRDNNSLFPPQKPNQALATPPETPSQLAPEAMTKISGESVTLKWESKSGLTVYHLQVATDPNFKWLVVNEPLFSGTNFELKNLEAGKHYHWRVAGVLPNNDAGSMKGHFARSMFSTPEK